jgi:tryptophan-rich sensory protein
MKATVSKDLLGLGAWLLVTFAAAAVGAAASIRAAAFYLQLVRPSWAPSAGVFGPVWSVLYLLMALAAWRVWRKGGFRLQRRALVLFLVQLVLNAIWSWLFFGWHLGALAFADILLLLAVILGTLILFWKVERLAGALLVPYFAWVSFASVLNFAVWQLNPTALG